MNADISPHLKAENLVSFFIVVFALALQFFFLVFLNEFHGSFHFKLMIYFFWL